MIPCKSCGALSDSGVGLCPDCVKELRDVKHERHPGIVDKLEEWVSEGYREQDGYVRSLLAMP